MKKLVALVIALLALFALISRPTTEQIQGTGVAQVTASAKQATAGWQGYKSTQGIYSVLMPSTPTETKRTANTPVGPLDMYISYWSDDTTAYVVMFSDYTKSVIKNEKPDQMQDNMRDAAVSSVQGKLLNEYIISLGVYPGREFRIETPDGAHTAIMRGYLVGNRAYSIGVTTTKEKSYNKSVTEFLDSFKLTGDK